MIDYARRLYDARRAGQLRRCMSSVRRNAVRSPRCAALSYYTGGVHTTQTSEKTFSASQDTLKRNCRPLPGRSRRPVGHVEPRQLISLLVDLHRHLYQASLGNTVAQQNRQGSDGHVSKDTRNIRPLSENVADRQGYRILNATFQRILADNDIHWYSTENEDIKASIVERFNRKLKTNMSRYFTYKNLPRHIDMLLGLVASYNVSYHRLISMSPNEVKASNEDLVRKRLYLPKKSARRAR